MMPRLVTLIGLALALLASPTSFAQPADIFPGTTWTQLAPAQSGWSAEGLAKAETISRAIGSAGVVVVQHGVVVAAWGETDTDLLLNSARKSLASALIGIAVSQGKIDLAATMGRLGIDDTPPPLTEAEKQATVRDLLEARSGIYHPANYETPGMAANRPTRGSHPHDTFWYYNNWDFNALGTILERATGMPIFATFQREIAAPIGMQDFDPAKCKYSSWANSSHPAYLFYASARDLARFGLLYLRQGRWRDRQIIPATWIHDSVQPYSVTRRGTGYGYLWWTGFPDREVDSLNLPAGGFFAWGNGGQFVFVIPSEDLVIAHVARRTDARREGVTLEAMAGLLAVIRAAEPAK